MTGRAAGRDRGRKWLCVGCGARQVGPSDLVACPECGDRVKPLYSRRRKRIVPPVVRSDG